MWCTLVGFFGQLVGFAPSTTAHLTTEAHLNCFCMILVKACNLSTVFCVFAQDILDDVKKVEKKYETKWEQKKEEKRRQHLANLLMKHATSLEGGSFLKSGELLTVSKVCI